MAPATPVRASVFPAQWNFSSSCERRVPPDLCTLLEAPAGKQRHNKNPRRSTVAPSSRLQRDFLDRAANMINFNLSASFNVLRLLFKPNICLPHHTVSTFGDLPIPLDKALKRDGRSAIIKAVVLDKDDCFAYPDTNEIHEPYKVSQSSYPP